ncbi:hypothetical protein E0Z10_g4787 [Xylaria hypoxylon]|uniref:Uncharacterized protein n=1 Tax=Xylaria hypoxylon TaxID=37992 RepID=A0A4Z0YJG1_9PEZI|nr:hypothetical protein E0Z10_g4787 [Xylaria hypoxylon]
MVEPINEDISLSESIPTLQSSVQELGRLIKPPDSDLPADELIDAWYDKDTEVSEEEFALRILKVFQESTYKKVYKNVVGQLPCNQRDAVEGFVSGSLSAEEANNLLTQEIPVVEALMVEPPSIEISSSKVAASKIQFGGTQSPLFQNWCRTVKNTLAMTYLDDE